jgi:uncharacterized membrane protein
MTGIFGRILQVAAHSIAGGFFGFWEASSINTAVSLVSLAGRYS